MSLTNQSHGNYQFGYGIKDGDGSENFRKESGEGKNKWGSYGLRDSDGRWRIVNYIADEKGFRVKIDSNEPGVISSAPAGVIINGPDAETHHEDHPASGPIEDGPPVLNSLYHDGSPHGPHEPVDPQDPESPVLHEGFIDGILKESLDFKAAASSKSKTKSQENVEPKKNETETEVKAKAKA